MTFAVRTRQQQEVTDRDPTVYVLESPSGARAEVWPAFGFNCFHWQVPHQGENLNLLFQSPDFFDKDGRPTRTGIPILFPFPNRIRTGTFTWEGKTYQLECNDSSQKNAIHGFVCRRPWRILDQGGDANSAWLTGVFRGSVDAPECRNLWPADYEIQITHRLAERSLRIETKVINPDSKPLPFGLGFHPYFRLPFMGNGEPTACTVQVPAKTFWVLDESLPTGERLLVDPARDLNAFRPYGDVQVDDVLSDLPAASSDAEGLVLRGTVNSSSTTSLQLHCSPAFREMVVFTPRHRQAFCIEPYTCVSDAINLQQRGVDAGWQVLASGESWSAVVKLRVE